MKRAEGVVEILEAFDLTGSYRAARPSLPAVPITPWRATSGCGPQVTESAAATGPAQMSPSTSGAPQKLNPA